MTPAQVALGYDAIAERWASPDFPRDNGIPQHERALAFAQGAGHALDAGCGCNGRIVDLLQARGYEVEGVDVSARMVELARARHPGVAFHHADICEWKMPRRYDFISAWDSIWHVPLACQAAVLAKLLNALAPGGVCIFSMGGLDAPGEKTDAAMGPAMYYATPGIPATLDVLAQTGCVCRHLEFDQRPESHLYIIAQRNTIASGPR
ncbi:MAG TPA: class I SAM-dependent methyltransferase [Burkholderiales bacterium]|nr:class I SAM-dependent methyltransferase [Burkholderiales bacterium]